jgi:hypothetical protein
LINSFRFIRVFLLNDLVTSELPIEPDNTKKKNKGSVPFYNI